MRTRAISGDIRYIAASSLDEFPIRRSGCVTFGSCCRTCDRSSGLSFEAQPAQEAKLVSLSLSSESGIVVSYPFWFECLTDILNIRMISGILM